MGSFLCISGCGSSSGPNSDQASFEKKTGANPNKQEAFIKELEAVPAAQRRAFMDQHPADMRNIVLIRDPDLQERVRKAMGAK